MKTDFAHRFTGAAFIAAALMAWLGWALLPVRPGPFFDPDVFGKIHSQFHLWIWMYRVHIFGLIIFAIALVAMGTLVAEESTRVLIWPGIAVAVAGAFVGALAEAFYYHHGAWGAQELADKSADASRDFVAALRADSEYVTCLTRFGRVFTGLGLILIGWGWMRARFVPVWLAGIPAVLGFAAMTLTMSLPNQLGLYAPIFHLQALWLFVMGIVVWRGQTKVSVSVEASRG